MLSELEMEYRKKYKENTKKSLISLFKHYKKNNDFPCVKPLTSALFLLYLYEAGVGIKAFGPNPTDKLKSLFDNIDDIELFIKLN